MKTRVQTRKVTLTSNLRDEISIRLTAESYAKLTRDEWPEQLVMDDVNRIREVRWNSGKGFYLLTMSQAVKIDKWLTGGRYLKKIRY